MLSYKFLFLVLLFGILAFPSRSLGDTYVYYPKNSLCGNNDFCDINKNQNAIINIDLLNDTQNKIDSAILSLYLENFYNTESTSTKFILYPLIYDIMKSDAPEQFRNLKASIKDIENNGQPYEVDLKKGQFVNFSLDTNYVRSSPFVVGFLLTTKSNGNFIFKNVDSIGTVNDPSLIIVSGDNKENNTVLTQQEEEYYLSSLPDNYQYKSKEELGINELKETTKEKWHQKWYISIPLGAIVGFFITKLFENFWNKFINKK